MKIPLIGIKMFQANWRKYLVLMIGLLFACVFYGESVNSAPTTAKLKKCPFTIYTLLKELDMELREMMILPRFS